MAESAIPEAVLQSVVLPPNKKRPPSEDYEEQGEKRQRAAHTYPGTTPQGSEHVDSVKSAATTSTVPDLKRNLSTGISERAAAAQRPASTADRQRSKRLFGSVLGALGRKNDETVKKRQAIEERARNEAQKQDQELAAKSRRRKVYSIRDRQLRQLEVDEDNMNIRHSSLRDRANFLTTKTKPILHYRPWKLLRYEEAILEDQKLATRDKIEQERFESSSRRQKARARYERSRSASSGSDRETDSDSELDSRHRRRESENAAQRHDRRRRPSRQSSRSSRRSSYQDDGRPESRQSYRDRRPSTREDEPSIREEQRHRQLSGHDDSRHSPSGSDQGGRHSRHDRRESDARRFTKATSQGSSASMDEAADPTRDDALNDDIEGTNEHSLESSATLAIDAAEQSLAAEDVVISTSHINAPFKNGQPTQDVELQPIIAGSEVRPVVDVDDEHLVEGDEDNVIY